MYAVLTHSGEITREELGDLAEQWLTSFGTRLVGWTHVQNNVQQLDCVLYGGGGEAIEVSTASPFVGSQTGGFLAANTSILINWDIIAHYRGGHPRTYLTGVPAQALDDNSFLLAAAQAALQTRVDTFLSEMNATTSGGVTEVRLGTVSFVTAGAWRTPPIMRIYDSGLVSGELATQRRRLRPSSH